MASRLATPPAPLLAREKSSTEGLLLYSLAATATLVVLPGLTVALLVRLAGASLTGIAGWLVTAAVSFAYMLAGAKTWRRHPRSANLSFGELVLWSWARRRRAEGTLKRGADLLEDELDDFLNPQGRRAQIKVLRELNAALEVRDPYTRGHARRVERHAHRIALALRCSDDDIFDIRLAASLHDVGKIKVPDRVLRKDGPLDDYEWAVMKQHSEVGAELVTRLGNPNVVAAVRSHHERWDGSGYPDGLFGTRIPLGARIIAVADTFDAITSCRPYRNRSDRAHAVAVLKSEAGGQFDPAVVSAFLSTTPHQAVAFAGLAALVAPFARKIASQWGVVFNKVGAVSLAGTMTASAFTGAAAVERPWEKRKDRAEKSAAAAPGGDSEATATVEDSAPSEGSSSPDGKALGHAKKAHEGGNGKSRGAERRNPDAGSRSHAGGNGKSHAGGNGKAPAESHAGGNGKSHAGGNGKSNAGDNDKSNAGGNGKSQAAAHSSKGVDDRTKTNGKPADPAAGTPAADAPAPEPAQPEPAKPAKPKEEPAAPDQPAEAPVAEAPAEPAPEPGKDKDKSKDE